MAGASVLLQVRVEGSRAVPQEPAAHTACLKTGRSELHDSEAVTPNPIQRGQLDSRALSFQGESVSNHCARAEAEVSLAAATGRGTRLFLEP